MLQSNALHDVAEWISQIMGYDTEHLVPRVDGSSQCFLYTLAIRDVTEHDREECHFAHDHLGNTSLGRELLAIFAKTEDVLSFTEFAGNLITSGKAGEVPAMDRAKPFGDESVE